MEKGKKHHMEGTKEIEENIKKSIIPMMMN